ncbi:MAG: hypothetical protein KF805_11295 [Phycisphaeraceae bacterium]|nr:hypothetical protein [Phycisphaeraceae bacterium]
MKKRAIGTGLVFLSLSGAALALVQTAQQGAQQSAVAKAPEKDDDEEVISLDKAPEAVRAAAIKLAGDAKNVTKVIKEEDDEDIVTYEVEYNERQTKCAAVFSVSGELMETERATTEAKLPAAVLEALKKEYPNATFADPQVVTKMYFEIDVVRNGKKHEIKVNAAGDIEDEADDEHEHGDGKGEKHEGKHEEKGHEGKKDRKD